MVKRIVDTAFWQAMQVIDHYSVEDKYFYLYLMTNPMSTQVGIYALPKKVMSFETGYTSDVIQVLLDRFSQSYKKIIYSEKTQEITLLDSLKVSVLTGGKPVSNLMIRELTSVKDPDLILATYERMKDFWDISNRQFDHTIKEFFEKELERRELSVTSHSDNQNQKQSQKQKQNQIHNQNHNQSHNHNQDSYSMTRGTSREKVDEMGFLDDYANYLKKAYPELEENITSENLVCMYYKLVVGDWSPLVKNQLRAWEKAFPTSLILEALSRSLNANHILPYAGKILENWELAGVRTYKDVVALEGRVD